MYEIGRICLKIAGRDANKYCVILDGIKDNLVLVDGQTRRKKVNLKHLEPTKNKIEIKKNADHSIVVEEFSKLDIKISLKKSKPKTERHKKAKKVKEKPVKEKKVKEKSKKEKVIDVESKVKDKSIVEEKKDLNDKKVEKKVIKEEKPKK
jgi:large subunit ribosomal protein L14e